MKDFPAISPEKLDQIERYLRNQLSLEERSSFETLLTQDENLSKALSEVKENLRILELSLMSDEIKNFHQRLPKAKQSWIKPWQKVAAAGLGFLLVALVYFLLRQTPEEKLFLSYFEPDPGLVTAMDPFSDYEFGRGMVDYKRGDFDGASKRWESLLAEGYNSDTLQFYLGNSRLKLGELELALENFDAVSTDSLSVFRSDAFWYQGLIHLKNGDREKAIESLSQSDFPQAAELIQKLNE